MNDEVTTFPLSYPVNHPRTKASERKDARFNTRSRGYGYGSSRKHTVHESARELEMEIRRMGGKDMIISSNLRVKGNGLPYSGQKQPDDPGVAVYFKWNKRDLVWYGPGDYRSCSECKRAGGHPYCVSCRKIVKVIEEEGA